MENCVFCKIINGEFESSKVFEDADCLAFLDIQPVNPGHVLIIPKIHKKFIYELDESIAAKMFIIANKINKAIRNSSLKCEGINYFLADGEAAFQEVSHTHLHCFPRYQNDGFKLNFSEQYYNAKPERSELHKIAEMLKNAII